MAAMIPFTTSLAVAAPGDLGPGSPAELAMLCMGGPPMTVATEDLKITVTFVHARTAGPPQKTGECSLGDRPLADNEPTELVLTGGGPMETELAALAAQPMPFSLLASPGEGTLEVTSLLTNGAVGGGGESNDMGPGADVNTVAGPADDYGSAARIGSAGPGSENNLGTNVNTAQGPQDEVAGPGMDTNVGGPGSDASAAGPGTEVYSAGPPSTVPGSEGPGSEGPGMQASASDPGTDTNGQGAQVPGVQTPVAGYGASIALPAADFTGSWHITGNVGEHFNLTLKAAADGTITGTYFEGRAGTYPKGDIIGGRVTGSQLLAQYRYQAKKSESDTGQILFTLTGPAALTAIWTDGDVVPSPDTAGGTWDGTR